MRSFKVEMVLDRVIIFPPIFLLFLCKVFHLFLKLLLLNTMLVFLLMEVFKFYISYLLMI